MFARTLAIHIQPGRLDEAITMFADSVIPAAQQQHGFISVMLLTDPATSSGLIVGLWETEEDIAANEANGFFQEQISKFGSLFAAPPVRTVYEVSAGS